MNEERRKKAWDAVLAAETLGRWILVAGLTGIACGLIGGAFSHVLTWVTRTRLSNPWLLYCMPLAGLFIVWSYKALGMENDSGTNQIIASVRDGEKPPLRLMPLIFISTALTHLTGGSAGREGAALQLGGSVAAGLGRLFHLNTKNMNLMVMCGMSGMFTALFGTPLTAAVFSLEVVSVGVMHYSGLFPCILTSLVSLGVTRLLAVEPEVFALRVIPAMDWSILLRVAVLGILCGLLSMIFCIVIHKAAHLYQKYIPDQYIRVLVGAGLVILLSVLEGSFDYNGGGTQVIARALEGGAVPSAAFLTKLVFTALTLGAGFRGGEIVPTFFVGATFGCTVAPLLGLDPAFGAAIGMVSLFCAVVNCPLASVLLSVELFGGDTVLFFSLACALSFLLSGKFSLYSSQKLMYSKLEPRYLGENAR